MHGSTVKNENNLPLYVPLPVWRHCYILFVNFLAFMGILLIVYGMVVVFTGQPYPLIEKFANPLANFSTLAGVLLTALSIYSKPVWRKPDPFSTQISAPIIILAVLIAVGILVFTKISLPTHVINGFAILGIAGGLFRTISW